MSPRSRRAFAAGLAASLCLLSACESPYPVATQGQPAVPALASASAEAAPATALDPALLRPAEAPFRLGPGDELDIELVGDTSTLTTTTVGPDGKIYYYMLPGLDIWGLTLPEARARLDEQLKKYFREAPVVSLTLRTAASQRFWILGRVSNPGVYLLPGPTSLLDALALAGGLSSASSLSAPSATNTTNISLPGSAGLESADLSRSFLIRQGHFIPVDFQRLLRDGDLTQNIFLRPDDFIFVPGARTPQVHILGAVVRPQSEKIAGILTLVQAIALAGGTQPDAKLANVAILRGSLAHPEIAIVAVDDVLHGKAADVRLEANDIVYVPYSTNRTLNRYVNLILDTFVRTVGVNEGAYAVTGKNTPVGVGVNLTP